MTPEEIYNLFDFHPTRPGEAKQYIDIREAGRNLAQVINDNTPPSADQTAAIRKVREAVMTAHAAIALNDLIKK